MITGSRHRSESRRRSTRGVSAHLPVRRLRPGRSGGARRAPARGTCRPGRAASSRARFPLELAARVVERRGRFVRARRRDRIEHVDDADDLGQQRNLLAAQPIGIAAAVEPLMVMAHDRPRALQRSKRAAQAIADHRVLLHDLEFLRGERTALQQDRVGHADLADVVEHAAIPQGRRSSSGSPSSWPSAPAYIESRWQCPSVNASRASIVSARLKITDSAESRSSVWRLRRSSDRTRACSSGGLIGLVRKSSAPASMPRMLVRRVLQRGHEDDRNQTRRRIAFQRQADLESGLLRHHHVEQHQIGLLLAPPSPSPARR